MSKESALRKKILNTLFGQKGKGLIVDVIDTCGIAEFGVDIVVITQDAFGINRYHGIQIKIGSLTNRKKVSRKIKEIIGQLILAHSSGYKHTDGTNHEYSSIYLVIDGDVSNSARLYLNSVCSSIPHLHVLGRPELDDFFRKFQIIVPLKET